jgi:hypothetical protein
MLMIVLLKDAWMWAIPSTTERRVRFRARALVLLLAFAIALS